MLNDLLLQSQNIISQLSALNEEFDKLTEENQSLVTQSGAEASAQRIKISKRKYEILREINKIENQNLLLFNKIKALQNGGSLFTITDKKGLTHPDVPDFRKVNTNVIGFNVENILTEPEPNYIPKVDKEEFRSKGYVFDAIRIDNDEYILATNGYKEQKQEIDLRDTNQTKETNYVLVTLDQLVLINDYYFKLAQGHEAKEAEKKNEQSKEYYLKLPLQKREAHFAQANYYLTLPANLKKKVTREQWDSFTLQQKESWYLPIKTYRPKKLESVLESNQMWKSFHKMYERFVNPLATEFLVKNIRSLIAQGFYKELSEEFIENSIRKNPNQVFGHPEVFEVWNRFADFMRWKLRDIEVQREQQSEIRDIAMETSFGESNTNDTLKNQFGVLAKRQDGSKINPVEVNEIAEAITKIESTLGFSIKQIALQNNLKISHTGTKHVFASKAIGVYIPFYGTIACSAKYGAQQFVNTLSHELAHFLDNKIGEKTGKRWLTDDYESLFGKLAFTFRKLMNEKSDSKYTNATKECFARAIQQYFAIETFGFNAKVVETGGKKIVEQFYFTEPNYVNNNNYTATIKPLVQQVVALIKTHLQ